MNTKGSLAFAGLAMAATLIFSPGSAFAQNPPKKKQTIEVKASTQPSADVAKLKKPGNEKEPKPETKSRGDVYGPNYSDIIVDNYTGYSIDIYVDGNFRGTVGAYDKRVTWAIPGNTRLYGKAEFSDGTYIYWGPTVTYTGYEYTWKLTR